MTAPATDPSVFDQLNEELDSKSVRKEREYFGLLDQLSQQSVTKYFNAYRDIPWDDPEYKLDPTDPRFILTTDHTLGRTDWYQSQPEEVQARLALHMTATFAKVGTQFESVLMRGLLEFSNKLPNNSPEFRYIYHEIGEEIQHSMMFQEFVNRSGLDIGGLPPLLHRMAQFRVVRFARNFPEVFFFFVLAGEDPIDHIQRMGLKKKAIRHPLLKRISQIHIIEEARHLSFARAYLRQHVPLLSARKRLQLRFMTPAVLGVATSFMSEPSSKVVAEYKIPRSVMEEAFWKNPDHKQLRVDAVSKIRDLAVDLDVVIPPFHHLWKRAGIWPRNEDPFERKALKA